MDDRAEPEAERLTITAHTIAADTRAHIARLRDDLAATRAAAGTMRRDLAEWSRVLAEIERRERYRPGPALGGCAAAPAGPILRVIDGANSYQPAAP